MDLSAGVESLCAYKWFNSKTIRMMCYVCLCIYALYSALLETDCFLTTLGRVVSFFCFIPPGFFFFFQSVDRTGKYMVYYISDASHCYVLCCVEWVNECHKTHKTFYNVESATKFILTTELMSLFLRCSFQWLRSARVLSSFLSFFFFGHIVHSYIHINL